MTTEAHAKIEVPAFTIATRVIRTDESTWCVNGEAYSTREAAWDAALAWALRDRADVVDEILNGTSRRAFGWPYGIEDEKAARAFVLASREQAVSAALRAAHGLR